jgi:colicin import membrane protein
MNLRAIPRTAVSGYFTLVRLPIDRAVALLPGDGTGARPVAELGLDRLDARLRAIAGFALRDEELRSDAARRHSAVQERARALRLRTEADRRGEEADSQLEKRQKRASGTRRRAAQQAAARRRDAAAQRDREKQEAAEAEAKRQDANQRVAERAAEVLAEQEPKERLEALNERDEALREREQELAVRNEARHLEEMASAAKAERKEE